MQWTEKYRPKIFSEIGGQEEAVSKIKKFIEESYLGKLIGKGKKALLLHGPPGVGKTTLAHVAAKEYNAEIFELNASDLRNKGKLQEVLKPAMEQTSLTKKTKIILVDEVDGISGYYDRGGVSELISLINNSSYPIIITANDPWVKKLSNLRRKTELVKLKEIGYSVIKDILIGILRKENNFIENDILTEISIKAKGDLRAAINDLQKESSVKSKGDLKLDERNKERDIFSVLKEIFKGKPSQDVLFAFDSLNMQLDEVMLWIEKNIPLEYQGEELARAFDLLSKADIFKGRIYKQQYWRFLVYENIFLSYGISSIKDHNKTQAGGFTSYQKPDRILKIWMNNRKVEKKKTISQKYSKFVHIGEKRAMREFPMIVKILKNPRIQEELRLSEDEIDYLREF